MLIKEKLQSEATFSDTENAIAKYFLKRKENLKKDSVRLIASEVYVSPSAVIRFCKKLGYLGYNDFRNNYLNELVYLASHFKEIDPNFPFQEGDSPLVISNKLAILYQETIKDCLSLIEPNNLKKAVEILNNANYIFICTSGAQIELTNVFKDKMLRIGKTVIIYPRNEDIYYEACYSKKDSCFILISYSGETYKTLSILEKLKKRDIPYFAITSYGGNSLALKSKCCLYVSTREKLVNNLGTFGFNISIIYLLDVLYANCFNFNYHENFQNKIENTSHFEKTKHFLGRYSNNSILKDD